MSHAPAPIDSSELAPHATPRFFELFRHIDGGIYRFVVPALHSEDQAELYVYEHIWPFTAGAVWARPAAEWASRFTRISDDELTAAMRKSRSEAQAAIARAKMLRRAKAATRPSDQT